MSRKTMRRLIADGLIAADRIGASSRGHWRIDRESIDSYFGRTEQKILAKIRGLRQ
jgi:ribosomal protein L19E